MKLITERPIKRMMMFKTGDESAVHQRVVTSWVQDSEGSSEMKMKTEHPI